MDQMKARGITRLNAQERGAAIGCSCRFAGTRMIMQISHVVARQFNKQE
jgi:hypothetical protein